MSGGRRPTGDFTAQAEAYVRSRPTYPEGAVSRLLDEAGVRAGACVLEIGAGTGIFSRALAARGLAVTAVEPNRAMRRLAAPRRGVRFVGGRFEALGFRDGVFDLAVAAQSFHWAEPSAALPEIRRVLGPRRSFAALWNERRYEDHPYLARTWEIVRRRVPEFFPAYRGRDWSKVLCAGDCFEPAATFAVDHEVQMDRERYLDLWRSHHRLAEFAGPQRLARLVEEIAARWPAGESEVRVPYRCRVFLVRRC